MQLSGIWVRLSEKGLVSLVDWAQFGIVTLRGVGGTKLWGVGLDGVRLNGAGQRGVK